MGEASIRAVDDVSLHRAHGRISGAAHLRLRQIDAAELMAGLEPAYVRLDSFGGRNLAELSSGAGALPPHTVGMVFQSFNLLPRMTLEENEELHLAPGGSRSRRTSRARAGSAGARASCETHWPSASELSGGEQQRTAIAPRSGESPENTFCREPTGNLDSATGEANPHAAA